MIHTIQTHGIVKKSANILEWKNEGFVTGESRRIMRMQLRNFTNYSFLANIQLYATLKRSFLFILLCIDRFLDIMFHGLIVQYLTSEIKTCQSRYVFLCLQGRGCRSLASHERLVPLLPLSWALSVKNLCVGEMFCHSGKCCLYYAAAQQAKVRPE